MKSLEKEQDRIQKICDVLRKQTIEPAHADAEKIISEAKARAEQIVRDAERQAEHLVSEARKNIERERNVFHSTLSQATKQSLEALRQAIEHQLFNPALNELVIKEASDPKVIAQLITAMITALEKEGLSTDLSASIPASISPQQVNSLLAKSILNKLKDNSVTLDTFAGGAKVRLEGKNITLDISNTEIEELIQRFIRKDFRTLLFSK